MFRTSNLRCHGAEVRPNCSALAVDIHKCVGGVESFHALSKNVANVFIGNQTTRSSARILNRRLHSVDAVCAIATVFWIVLPARRSRSEFLPLSELARMLETQHVEFCLHKDGSA